MLSGSGYSRERGHGNGTSGIMPSIAVGETVSTTPPAAISLPSEHTMSTHSNQASQGPVTGVVEIREQIEHVMECIRLLSKKVTAYDRLRRQLSKNIEPPISEQEQAEQTEKWWSRNVQCLIDSIRRELEPLRWKIETHWSGKYRWDSFCGMLDYGKDNYAEWKATGWPEIHIQELQAVSRALDVITQKRNGAGQPGETGRANAQEAKSEMTLDRIVNEVHTCLEPIRTQCDLFCQKAEEYAVMLEKYTGEAFDRHMTESDRRQKERERLGVQLLPGESFFPLSEREKLIRPTPQEEESKKGPPYEGWIWTQRCDYNYINLSDKDVFWRPPDPSYPLEWLWLSLPWWGYTSPTLARTKREWTDEERLMCECLFLASIHDMRFVTAPSRHERIFHGKPYSGRFQRDKVASDLWYAMDKNPRALEDLQLSWDWVERRLNKLEQRQEKPNRQKQASETAKKVGKGGRKPLPAKEATKRQALIQSWTQARESGICKYDFCEEQGIDQARLDKCLDWNRHKRESHQ